MRLERCGSAALDARTALGVEAPPAETAVEVSEVDRGESGLGVDVLDAGANVEAIIVGLGALVGVEGLTEAEGPLALAA